MFSEEKVAQMAAYLLVKRSGRMAYFKLMKLKSPVNCRARKDNEGNIKPQSVDIEENAFKKILDDFDISDEVEPKMRRFWGKTLLT